MRSKVSKLVETCRQAEKWPKGLKRQKSFCGFADALRVNFVGWAKVQTKSLSYIMQMTRTTNCVYNRSSHSKKAKIGAFVPLIN